jgi:UDP-glucose 4-epimerase
MKVAILGASSFLGKHIASGFTRNGAQVTSFVRKRFVGGMDVGHQVEFDFRDTSSFGPLMPGFDLIIHLVSSSTPASSRIAGRSDVENNLIPTIELIKVLVDSPSTKVVFASSGGAVYGNPVFTPIPESHATDPVSPYGVSKLAIEKYLHIARLDSGLDYRILRLSNPYGPGQTNKNGQGLIPTVIEKAVIGDPVTVWGDGSNTRDYVYVDDVVDAFIRAASYSGAVRVFNVGSGVGLSVIDIVSDIGKLLENKIVVNHEPGRLSDPDVNILDVELAKSSLGWSAKTTFDQGLSSTMDWNRIRLGISS